jgi:hypothetical protein
MRNHNGRLPKNNHQTRTMRYRRNSDPVQQRIAAFMGKGVDQPLSSYWVYPNPRTAVAQAKTVQHGERLTTPAKPVVAAPVKPAPDPRRQPLAHQPAKPVQKNLSWHAYQKLAAAGAGV